MAMRGGPVSCNDWLLSGRGLLSNSAPSVCGSDLGSEVRLSCWGGETPEFNSGYSVEDSIDSVSMETGSCEVS